MKTIFTLIIALLGAAATASAGSVITAVVNNGNWYTPSAWNLNRVPADDDTIIIPPGITINFTTNQTLNTVIVEIRGRLELSSSAKLNLNNQSVIRVYGGARIGGQGNDDQIRIGGTNVFKGNDQDVVGPVYADETTGGEFASMSLMPVTFANFYVSQVNEDVLIRWTTATENNNNHFEVQRSFDGQLWSTIAVVNGVGNSTQLNNYAFTDKNMKKSLVFYRITQVDNDGRSTYTVVRILKNSETEPGVEVFASKNKTVTILFDEMKSFVAVQIFTITGQAITQQRYTHSAYITLSLSNAISGAYVVKITDQDHHTQSKKIMLN